MKTPISILFTFALLAIIPAIHHEQEATELVMATDQLVGSITETEKNFDLSDDIAAGSYVERTFIPL